MRKVRVKSLKYYAHYTGNDPEITLELFKKTKDKNLSHRLTRGIYKLYKTLTNSKRSELQTKRN